MRRILLLVASVLSACAVNARAEEKGVARPNVILQQLAAGMPRDETQEIRVITATFNPGDRTVTHTHRFPVTVYVLEGVFSLELTGREPIHVKAGEALIEPPHVTMTGYNRSATEKTRVVIFYTSTQGTPFLDPHH